MIDAFSQLKFWCVFDIFDPRKLPQSVTEISSYENREITVLIDHYGKEKASTYKSVALNQVGDIDGVAAVEECPGFRKHMFEKRKAEEEKFQMNLMNCKNEKERDTLRASETSFDAHKLYSTCLNDKACAIIFPNCLKLLHLMLIFPLSTACVKRFFSLLHKTLLICINIFRDNTIIAYVITFSNKILNKLCDLMTNSFQLNTHFFFFFRRKIYSGKQSSGRVL